jgi:class 3 adenylate cyclase
LEDLDFEKDGMFVFFSTSIALNPETHKVVHGSFQSSYQIEAGATLEIEMELQKEHYILMAPVTHSTGHIPVEEGNDDHEAEFELLMDGQIAPEISPLGSGAATIRVHNRTKQKVVVGLLKDTHLAPFDNETREYPIQPLFSISPYLRGKQLISNQIFRDLFHAESIPTGGGLEFKSMTFLFTDLKGSTAMYDRIGDFQAYSLVNAHFALLRGIIAAQGGAVIKTMGDAIMASFADPVGAVIAAQLMLREMKNLGLGEDLILKIGIHCGPTLAVSANNQLDYFGQTVNIANRVQSQANPGEIIITEPVYSASEVRDLLGVEKLTAAPEQVSLKGVAEDISFFRLQ